MASGWWKSTHANLALGSPVDFVTTTTPIAPRNWDKRAASIPAGGFYLGGTPSTIIDDVIYYAGDNYTLGSELPTLCRFDGRLSSEVIEIPAFDTPLFDAISTGGFQDASWSHTITTRSNRYLLVWFINNGSTDPTAVTYGGSSLTKVASAYNAGSDYVMTVWAGGAGQTGANTVTVTTTATNFEGFATSYYNVTNAVPTIFQASTNSGSSPTRTGTVTTVGSGNWLVMAASTNVTSGALLTSSTTDAVVRGNGILRWAVMDTNKAVGVGSVSITAANSLAENNLWASITVALTPVSTVTFPRAVASLASDSDGNIYVATHDTGSPAGAGGIPASTYRGRVMKFVPSTGVISEFGGIASTIPYAICVFNSHLYVATSIEPNGEGLVAHLYRINLSTGVTTSVGNTTNTIACLVPFSGDLYAGTYIDGVLSFASVLKITTADAITTSNTVAPGGSATAYNGLAAGIVFESNLYMGYWNNDATPVTLIRKFTGSAWSTVLTISGAGARPIIGFTEADGTCYAYGGGDGSTGILYETTDGTSWTDVSSLLPSSREAVPFFGSINQIGGF